MLNEPEKEREDPKRRADAGLASPKQNTDQIKPDRQERRERTRLSAWCHFVLRNSESQPSLTNFDVGGAR